MFYQVAVICLCEGRGILSQCLHTCSSSIRCLFDSLLLTETAGAWAGRATLLGAVPWASSPPAPLPLAGVGAGLQEGQCLLHKAKKANHWLFLVQQRLVEASSTSCFPTHQRVTWAQRCGETRCWQSLRATNLSNQRFFDFVVSWFFSQVREV